LAPASGSGATPFRAEVISEAKMRAGISPPVTFAIGVSSSLPTQTPAVYFAV
jgi:hypothetical protein